MTAKPHAPSRLTTVQAVAIAPLSPGLILATGPVSYDYQFGTEGLLERVVAASWSQPETLFAAANTTAVFDDTGALAGIELGFEGPDFYCFKDNLGALGRLEHGEGLLEPARNRALVNVAGRLAMPGIVETRHGVAVPLAPGIDRDCLCAPHV